ncbi:hypothetical protein DRP77_07850 [Candidatus Poribacteria bacterium]|nr:MAG: hypothetical protein DRP77_07850 [Candidatus Poribacteria bacterium]
MLYLATLSRKEEAKGLVLTLTRERIVGLRNLPDLCPSRRLISRYRSGSISWEEFKEGYLNELREEYKRSRSRLRGLAEYAAEKDVTLLVPDDDFHVGYLSVLGDAVDAIWRRKGVGIRVQRLFEERAIAEPEVTAPPKEVERAERAGREPVQELLIPPKGERATARARIPEPYSKIPSLREEAVRCEFFQPKPGSPAERNCYFCRHFDPRIYACMKREMLLVEYEWAEPEI